MVSKTSSVLVSVFERPPPKKRIELPTRVATWHRWRLGRIPGTLGISPPYPTRAHRRCSLGRRRSSIHTSESSEPPSPGFMLDLSVQPPQMKRRPPTW